MEKIRNKNLKQKSVLIGDYNKYKEIKLSTKRQNLTEFFKKPLHDIYKRLTSDQETHRN
jgi:hypothetical protein